MDFIAHLCALLATVFYAVAAVGYTGLASDASLGGVTNKRLALLGGAFFHFSFLIFSKLASKVVSEIYGTPYTVCAIGFLLVVLFAVLEKRYKIEGLGSLVAPLALMLTILSGLLFHFSSPANNLGEIDAVIYFHIATTILGNVFFLFAFLVSITLLFQESSLRGKRAGFLKMKLPSLQSLDRLNSGILSTGFLMMSVGVAVGLAVIAIRDKDIAKLDPRLVSSYLTLGIYGLLVIFRMTRGWRGRRVAWLSIAGFATVLISSAGLRLLGGSFHVY